MDFDKLIAIHKELNGQCVSCGQKCDKRVVSLHVDTSGISKMLCPDCKNGNERPFFTASDNMIDFCCRHTKWNREQTILFLQTIPLGIALITFDENTREYWNWDTSKFIRKIKTDHDGNIMYITYYSKAKKQKVIKKKNVIVRNNTYKIVNKESRRIKNIHITVAFQQSNPREIKIQQNIEYYKKHGRFLKPIIGIRSTECNSKSVALIDGYTIYLAAQKLELRTAEVWVVERI